MKKVLLLSAGIAKKNGRLREIRVSFEELGFEAEDFCYNRFYFRHSQPTNWAINQALIQKVKRFKPDFLFVQKGESILPGVIKKIRSMGVVCANRTVDDVFGVHNPFLKISNIAEYDYVFSFDKFMVEELQKRKLCAHYLPCGAAVNFYKKLDVKKDIAVSFVGSHYPEREQWLSQLVDFPVMIWGPNWHRATSEQLRRKINEADSREDSYVTIINKSKIALNFIHKQSILSTNYRTFEVTAMGTFLLNQYNPELENLFEIGEEIETFKTTEELKKKISYYLENADERERIAKKGHQRTLKGHKIKDRVKEVVRVCQITKN